MDRLEKDLNKAVVDRERVSFELTRQIEVRAKLEEQVKQLQQRVQHLEEKLEFYHREEVVGARGERGQRGEQGIQGVQGEKGENAI